MNNNIIVTLKSSTTEMNLNSHEEGIYLIPDLEGLTSLPEIRTSSGVNAGADGGWTSAQFFDARSIAMKVVISNEDVSVVEQKRQALNSLLAQGRKEDLLLTVVTEAGNAYTVYVRPTSVSSALNQVLKVQEMLIQFRADDPLIYGEGSAGGEEAILHVQQALGGFAIPFKFPLAIGGGSGATTITNSGSESVYPVITLEGPLHSPTVINRTTNQQIQVLVDLANTINWAGEETAQGNYIQVNNQLDIPAALKSASLLGDAEQATYSGKNLCYETRLNGTNNILFFIDKPASNTITFSATINVATSGNSIYINVDGASQGLAGTITGGANTRQTVTLTLSDAQMEAITNGSVVHLILYKNNAGFTLPTDAQIELGSTATAYEPYVGGTASPNPDFPQAVNTVTGEQTVKIEGKNLFNYADVKNLALSATVVESSAYRGYYIPVVAGQKYTISRKSTTGNNRFRFCFTVAEPANGVPFYDEAGVEHGFYNADSLLSATVTVPSGMNYLFVYLSNNSETISGSLEIQIELGNSVSEYQPYQGQTLPVNLGKNLLENTHATGSTTTNGMTFIVNSDGTITLNGTATALTWFVFHSAQLDLPDGTYTISLQGGTNANIGVYNDKFGNTVLGSSTTRAITSASGNVSLRVASGATASNLTVKPMIELGSTATDFAPYFTPIELAKIGTYQDRIYKNDGKWYIEKQVGKVVLDGSETWSGLETLTNTTGAYTLYGGILQGAPCLSNYFVQRTSYEADMVGIVCRPYNSSLISLRFSPSTLSEQSIAGIKTWLSTHNTTVYYALATPTTTEITNTALITQLDALMEAQLYVGDNNISTTSVDLPAYLDIAFFTEYTRSIDKVVIDSQLQTVTFNGLDIYHQLSESSEFITIAPGENEMILTSTNTSDEGTATIKFKQGYLSI